MSEESIIAESYSNLKSAILLGRTDIVRGILSTAAESRLENGFFEDEEEDDENGEDFRIRKWDEDYEDNPYDILRVMLNYVDSDAGTALHLATKLGNTDITRALLAAGADPTRPNKEGATPFEYCADEKILKVYNEQLLEAAAHNQLTKLQRLLIAGVSANANDGAVTNNKVLHWAASFGGQEAVKLLCEYNADTNVKNSSGSTPLFDAVKRRHKDIVSILLSYGARTDVTLTEGPLKGKTPIDFAPDGSEIKKLLLSPPPRILPEKASTQVNGSPLESDVVEDGNTSSHNSPAEKTDIKTSTSEDDKSSPSREVNLDSLWPYPQQLTLIKGSCYFPEAYLSVRILKNGEEDPHYIHDMWRAVDESFKNLGFSIRILFVSGDGSDCGAVPGCITCSICPLLFSKSESYSINISSQKISLCANEPRSLWHSINTLLQLFRLSKGGGIPQMQINDWPDLKYRAFLVDVGHGRALNSESLLFLVDALSSLKYNQMVICLQNSYHFANHGEVTKNSSPYNQSDILKLDRYCRKRYIELIPYMDYGSDFSKCSSDHLSAGNANTTNIVRDLNAQLCSAFSSSRFVHVGMSAVDVIGTGASEESKVKDKECTLINHLKRVNENCEKHRKVSMFWVNSFHEYLKPGSDIPHGVVAMEYGGEPQYDFGVFCKLCSDCGIPYYVCPGTMSWSSLVGAANASVGLINDAVQSAVNFNALGILVTDWSAYGNVTPMEVSISAFAAGAALSWNSKMKQESVLSSLGKVLDLHVFQDEAGLLGEILQNLSEVHQLLDPRPARTESGAVDCQVGVNPDEKPENASLLLKLFLFPGNLDVKQLGSDNVQKAARCLRKCQASLSKVHIKCRRSSAIVKVLDLVIDMSLYACRVGRALALAKGRRKSADEDSIVISSLPNINRTDLANRLLGIMDNYQRVWLLSHKPEGLQESVQILQRVFEEIVPSTTLDV